MASSGSIGKSCPLAFSAAGKNTVLAFGCSRLVLRAFNTLCAVERIRSAEKCAHCVCIEAELCRIVCRDLCYFYAHACLDRCLARIFSISLTMIIRHQTLFSSNFLLSACILAMIEIKACTGLLNVIYRFDMHYGQVEFETFLVARSYVTR